MKQPAPKGIPQRVIEWWNARKGQAGTEDSSDAPETSTGGTGGLESVRQAATQIGGELRGAAREAGLRGKTAIDTIRHRGEKGSGVESLEIRGSEAAEGPPDPPDRPGGTMSPASGSSTHVIRGDASSATVSGTPAPATATETGSTSMSDTTASGGASASSSAAWASTSGVVDTKVGVPDAFVEGQQGGASGGATSGAQQPPDPDSPPTDMPTGSDMEAPVGGNAEEGTRNEAAGAARQATTDGPREDRAVQAPDDPIGGSGEWTPGTDSGASVLGAASDDGSSISEIESDPMPGDLEPGSPSTTLAADAYRSTTAAEEVNLQTPQPGSTIPDFATDSDEPTRTVESAGDEKPKRSPEGTSR